MSMTGRGVSSSYAIACVKLSDSRDFAKKKRKEKKRRPNAKLGAPHYLGKGAKPPLFAVLRTFFVSVFTVSAHNYLRAWNKLRTPVG